MTDDELILKITEFLEPMPDDKAKLVTLSLGFSTSSGGFWELYRESGLPIVPESFKWRPTYTIGSPILLKKLMEAGPISATRLKNGWRAFKPDFTLDGPRTSREDWPVVSIGRVASLDRAVAEAFAKAKGLI
jgi:hypothetical protein